MKDTKVKTKVVLFTAFLVGLIGAVTVLLFYGPSRFFPGYMGELVITSAGVRVPVVQRESPSHNGGGIIQFLVDRPACAAAYKLFAESFSDDIKDYSTTVICDHSSQGFDRIEKCQIGDIAQIVQPNGSIKEYEVIANFTGHNTRKSITDEDGNDVLKNNLGRITLYTCLESWEHIRIVFLRPKDI